jgi:hypothetical protein
MSTNNTDQFGNGLSLKYFNFLSAVYIPFVVLGTMANISSLYSLYVVTYDSNSELFYSVGGNGTTVLFLGVNIFMNLIVAYHRLVGNKKSFVNSFLLRMVVDLVGAFIIAGVYSSQFPDYSSDFYGSFIGSLFWFIVIFIPNSIYFSKRTRTIEIKDEQNAINEPLTETVDVSVYSENEAIESSSVDNTIEETGSPIINENLEPNVLSNKKMFCGQCGYKSENNQKYCMKCGNRL